jgi:hypothetical protein
MGKAKDEIGHSGLFTEKLGNKEGVKPDLAATMRQKRKCLLGLFG